MARRVGLVVAKRRAADTALTDDATNPVDARVVGELELGSSLSPTVGLHIIAAIVVLLFGRRLEILSSGQFGLFNYPRPGTFFIHFNLNAQCVCV